MKNQFATSVFGVQINYFAITFLLTLVFFFTQNATSVSAEAERCKVGDPSVAEYNKLSPSEQKEQIKELRREHKSEMEMTVEAFKGFFVDVPIEIRNRLKTVASTQEKIVRKSYKCFSSLTDIAGVMLVIPNYAAIPMVTHSIENEFDVKEEIDLINDKRGNGYRAIHYVVMVDGRHVEIQIHTARGNIWAFLIHELVYKGPYEEKSNVDKYLIEVSRRIFLLDSGFATQIPPVPADLPTPAKTKIEDALLKVRTITMEGFSPQK
jgi:ppGpp synthetase/RelA/SpoT-type nucleotidyltranferase